MTQNEEGLFGLLGNMRAVPGKRAELIAVLQESSRDIPGKLVYLIQLDRADADLFWINEVWQTQAHYDACLTMPQVLQGMERARPLIAGGDLRVETTPLGEASDYAAD